MLTLLDVLEEGQVRVREGDTLGQQRLPLEHVAAGLLRMGRIFQKRGAASMHVVVAVAEVCVKSHVS